MGLLQRNKSGRVGGTDTRPSVFDRLVSDAKFTQIMSNHFRLLKSESSIMRNIRKEKNVQTKSYLDFYLVEGLAIIDSYYTSDHLRLDNHVTQMGFDNIWFL